MLPVTQALTRAEAIAMLVSMVSCVCAVMFPAMWDTTDDVCRTPIATRQLVYDHNSRHWIAVGQG